MISDRIDPARARALMATLGREDAYGVGADLPPLSHLAFFWEPNFEEGLANDGHPHLGGMIPDLGLPIRMWAGGRLTFHAPFRSGVNAERITRLQGVTRKEGRSGKLGFVTLRHEVRQRGAPVLTEEQDLVYREAGSVSGEPPVVSEDVDERRALKLSEISLFRYSALTFNAHRIHYDYPYCREEGYAGLVVHGPLMATHLAMMASDVLGGLRKFSFRATAPLILGDVAWLCRAGNRFWVEGPRRRLCMAAEAE